MPSTALITGANSGIGLELSKRLLAEQWDVIALIRSDFQADDSQIASAQARNQLRVYRADIADLRSLHSALEAIKAHEHAIDLLFNNAAAPSSKDIRYSPQGFELCFAVNVIAPYIITQELKPLLRNGTHKTIVNTSSNALLFVRAFSLELLEHPPKYAALVMPYGTSKLALSLWTQALAPQLQAEGIEIRSLNPGATKTKMTMRSDFPRLLGIIRDLFFASPDVGAGRLYEVALGKWRGKTGVFINNDKVRKLPFAQLADAVLERVDQIYQQAYRSPRTEEQSATI